MKCNNCGENINPGASFCTKCGTKINKTSDTSGSGFGWGVLGFFVPLVGLILFIIWKDTKPISSKGAGIGALIGFCLNMLITIIYIIALAGVFFAEFM